MSLPQRLARAMTKLRFEMHFFTLTADRQRVLLFLESRDDGAVIEGQTMAHCIEALEREAAGVTGETEPPARRGGAAARRAARLGFRVIDGGADPGRREGGGAPRD